MAMSWFIGKWNFRPFQIRINFYDILQPDPTYFVFRPVVLSSYLQRLLWVSDSTKRYASVLRYKSEYNLRFDAGHRRLKDNFVYEWLQI